MLVVHLALTPLAGSPIRIVRALRTHTDIDARLVVFNPAAYGPRTFENDLTWENDKGEALELLDKADVVHFHHYFDLRHNPFGVNFTNLQSRGKALIRQFHSTPHFIAQWSRASVGEIVESPVPQLVIPHCAERYYPRARLVPNIVPLNNTDYLPCEKPQGHVAICYTPSTSFSAWHFPEPEKRWESKGLPETKRLLDQLARKHQQVRINVLQDTPHQQCLLARQHSHISIDEMVAGCFHLSSLEGLAQGVPTFAYLDQRTEDVLFRLTGTREHPWLNFRLEDAFIPLEQLILDSSLRSEIGRSSRQWMETYWNDRVMVQHYVTAYHDLLENPASFSKLRFDPNEKGVIWRVQGRDDTQWRTRQQRFGNRGATHTINKLLAKLRSLV